MPCNPATSTNSTTGRALLVDKLRKAPELRDVNSDQQTRGLQTTVVIDRDAAARLGVSPIAIDNTLYDAFGQRQVSTLYKRYNQHHVVLEVDPAYQQDPASLNKIYVRSTTGKQVPLAAVAKFKPHQHLPLRQSPGPIPRRDPLVQSGARRVAGPGHRGDSEGGGRAGTCPPACRAVSKARPRSSRPPSPICRCFCSRPSLAVYVVLGMLYESLIHPLTILSTLPSAGRGRAAGPDGFGL